MKRIRLAHLINFLSPAGKEIGIIKLLNALDSNEFENYLIVFDKVFDTLSLDPSKVKLISLNKRRGNDPLLPLRLARILHHYKIDILHTHAWGTLVEGIAAGRLAGVKQIIHGEHGSFHKDAKRLMVQRFFFNRADHLLSVSAVLADDLSATIGFPRKKMQAILNGVDTDRFYPDPEKRKTQRKIYGFGETDLVIGTVGRTVALKNQQLVIRAMHQLWDEFNNVHFVVVGDSPMYSVKNELAALAAELGVQEKIHLIGMKNEVPDLLNMFDLFVLPSLSEGCSNVIQEAMATGLPVVASHVGGNPELVQHDVSGFLFKNDDVYDLSQYLRRILTDTRLREEMGRAGLNLAREQFSLPAMIAAYRNFYLNSMGKA